MIRRTQGIVAEVMADRGRAGDRSVATRLLWSGTFHSVGNRILRLYAKHLDWIRISRCWTAPMRPT